MRFWLGVVVAMALVVGAGGAAVAADKVQIEGRRNTVAMKPEIKSIPRMTVAFVRGTWPADVENKGCGPAWERLLAWAKKYGLARSDTLYAGVCYDDPSTTPPERARYDACMSVPKGTKGEEDVAIGEIAGRNYAVFLLRGPYKNLKKTYAYIYGAWAPEAKRKLAAGPALEIYRTPDMDTPPERVLTEICIPLEK